jgi:hypothetical protein
MQRLGFVNYLVKQAISVSFSFRFLLFLLFRQGGGLRRGWLILCEHRKRK